MVDLRETAGSDLVPKEGVSSARDVKNSVTSNVFVL